MTRARKPARPVPWRAAPWVAVDLETTGLNLRHDDIVSVGAVPIVEGVVDNRRNLYSLMRPVRRVSPESIKIHALRPQDLLDAPAPSQVAGMLRSTCEGSVVIAHAAWIENAMLTRLSRGTRTPLTLPTVDTAALGRAAGVTSSEDHEPSLELMARKLRLPVYSPHHALGDAMTTAVVFLCLATQLDRSTFGGAMTVGDLEKITARDAQRRARW